MTSFNGPPHPDASVCGGLHDHTVRDYNNKIVQFRYNNWGLDPKYQVRVAGESSPQFADLKSVFGVC